MANKIPPVVEQTERFGTKESHESYGMIGVNRKQSNGSSLFGSSIEHHTVFSLTIRGAEKHRDLNEDRYYGRDELIQVDMSANQFLELMTNMNVGFGVPCTLRRVGGKAIDDCPEVNQRKVFEREFEETVKESSKKLRNVIDKIGAMFAQKTIKKADQGEVIGMLRSLEMYMNSHISFMNSQFNEAMDKTVSECKSEVAAFVESKINAMGLGALADELRKRLPTIGAGDDVQRLEQKGCGS